MRIIAKNLTISSVLITPNCRGLALYQNFDFYKSLLNTFQDFAIILCVRLKIVVNFSSLFRDTKKTAEMLAGSETQYP
jgi:hypothetical protein